MKLKTSSKHKDLDKYLGQAWPKEFATEFAKDPHGKGEKDAQKILSNPVDKDYKQKDQNKADAKTQISNISKSWQDQEKKFYKVVAAVEKILSDRFAKLKKAVQTSGEGAYKGVYINPLRESLYENFKSAGFDADTAHYIVENAFDTASQQTHESLVKCAENLFNMDNKEFLDKTSQISKRDRKVAKELVPGESCECGKDLCTTGENNCSDSMGGKMMADDDTWTDSETGKVYKKTVLPPGGKPEDTDYVDPGKPSKYGDEDPLEMALRGEGDDPINSSEYERLRKKFIGE